MSERTPIRIALRDEAHARERKKEINRRLILYNARLEALYTSIVVILRCAGVCYCS